MRLFVGIPLAGPAREGVLALREQLVETISRQGVRFVSEDKLHLTLSFLGDVDSSGLEDVQAALATTSEPHRQMNLAIAGVGCFPDDGRPRVIWTGVVGETQALLDLQASIATAMSPFGSHQEDKPYFPHITLARVSPGSKVVGRLLQPYIRAELNLGELPVNAVTLYESTPSGAYREVAAIALQS